MMRSQGQLCWCPQEARWLPAGVSFAAAQKVGGTRGSKGDTLPSCVGQLPTCCSQSKVT